MKVQTLEINPTHLLDGGLPALVPGHLLVTDIVSLVRQVNAKEPAHGNDWETDTTFAQSFQFLENHKRF